MTKGDIAYQNFISGMACAQSVLCAFSPEIGLDRQTLLKMSLPFGGGMGRMRLTCGAVSGMVMAYGLIKGDGSIPTSEDKSQCYKGVQYLAAEFKRLNNTVICAELLGLKSPENTHVPEPRSAEYYKKRPCPELCRIAADILEKYLAENP